MDICPICKGPAEEIEKGTPDRKIFRCQNSKHNELAISGTALVLESYKNSSATERETALEKARARAKPGERPLIMSYDFE